MSETLVSFPDHAGGGKNDCMQGFFVMGTSSNHLNDDDMMVDTY